MPSKSKNVGKLINSMMKKPMMNKPISVMNKPSGVMNKPDSAKQIGDMIKNDARNPNDYYKKSTAPIKKGRTAGPAERTGRKYGTKIGRTIDNGVNTLTSSVRSGANRVKGVAMDLNGEAKQRKFSGYDMLQAGAAGVAGYGIGQGLASKWTEHKRQQRGD